MQNNRQVSDETGRIDLKDLMSNAFAEHEARISELKEREVTMQAERAALDKKKEKLLDKETQLKKSQLVSEGTGHKLKIRKEELDKEWERVDQLRADASECKALVEKERASIAIEKDLVAAEKEEKV